MKTTLMIATVLAAGTSAAYAQEPPAQPPVTTASVPAASAPATSARPSPDRTSEVRVLEDIFVSSMNQGAADFSRQMQIMNPGTVIQGSVIVSPAHARGIALDGYGVLFDIDVPLMNMSILWSQRQIAVLNLRDMISEAKRLRTRATSLDAQQQLDARIQVLTNNLSIIAPPAPTPVANDSQPPAAGSVVAATIDPVAPIDTRSPDEMYSDAIKKALMMAMVNHSSALMLGDDEWLTVAARDNSGPTIPGTLNDRSGVMLRIKGSDLAAFRANKLSLDEVVKKIELKEWR